MFDDDVEDAYDEGYEEGQGKTGFFSNMNHNALKRELAHKKGVKDGRKDLEDYVEYHISPGEPEDDGDSEEED